MIGALLILVEGVLRARAGRPALRRVLNVWLAGDGIRAGRGWAFGAMGCTHAVVDASIPGLGHERVLSMAVPQVPELSSARLGIRLVKLDRSLPQVFVAQSPVLHDSEAAALAALSHAQTIEEIEGVIEDPLGRLAAGTILPIGDGAEPPGVEWLGAGHARVDIGGSGAALVGLRTAFLAGWTARQRGRDLPVLRATGNQVATLAEAGAGPIELEYRPRNLRASVASALGGVLVGLLVLTLTRRRSRAAATPAQPPAPPPATAGSP